MTSDIFIYFSRWSTFVSSRGTLATWWRGWLLTDGESGLKWWWILNTLSLQSSWLPMCRLCSQASQHNQVKQHLRKLKTDFTINFQGSAKELSSLRMISTRFVPGCSSPMMRLGNMTSWSVSFKHFWLWLRQEPYEWRSWICVRSVWVILNENCDIAIAMSSSHADPELGLKFYPTALGGGI